MITRRRFLAISAAAIATPAQARPQTWRSHALGAEVSVRLHMSSDPAPLFAAIEAELRGIADDFSLYQRDSGINRLNATGQLPLTPRWRALLPEVNRLHHVTGGRFDPTVQPLWQALARGLHTGAARRAVGWSGIHWDTHTIRLGAGQALTLNGIAQGYATDRIRTILRDAGLSRSLVNIGEFAALGGPYRLGLADPAHGILGHVTLDGTAAATSSPRADLVGGRPHILHPTAQPHWSSVSVLAETATLADGLSTALTLAPLEEARVMVRTLPGLRAVRLVADNGDLISI